MPYDSDKSESESILMAERSPAPILRHRRVDLMGPAAGISSSSMLATTPQEAFILSHKSDHVLHLAYNALLHGQRLEDIELRRNGNALQAGLGVQPI